MKPAPTAVSPGGSTLETSATPTPCRVDHRLSRARAAGAAVLVILGINGTAVAGEPESTHVFTIDDDTQVVGQLRRIETAYEDTFVDLGRRYNVGYEAMLAANPGVDPWLPGEGTAVVLPTRFVLPDAPRDGIVLNMAAMRLFYFEPRRPDGTQVMHTHPIGIGRVGWATPLGSTTVTTKAKNPTWYVPASIRREHAEAGDPLPAAVPPGPDNPLGEYAIKLAMPGYLIHGTNKPDGVGMRVSHGCIRLFPEDVEPLFEKVRTGTPVHIVDQPFLAGWQGGMLFFAAHAPLEDGEPDWLAALELLHARVEEAGGVHALEWTRASRVATRAQGLPMPVTAGTPPPDVWLARVPTVERGHTGNFRPTTVALESESPVPPASTDR